LDIGDIGDIGFWIGEGGWHEGCHRAPTYPVGENQPCIGADKALTGASGINSLNGTIIELPTELALA